MASNVQVLCPNGRRQTVKTTPNTKILQILEEVCVKQGFSANDHELISGRKTLDVTMILRYSGLPNHAKLELRKSEKERAESDVTVALVLESGERLMHPFGPATSLYDVLVYWEEDQAGSYEGKIIQGPEGTHPVVIYMREEVIGTEALKNTTLRKLGLTGGRMMLRLTHRQVDDETLNNILKKIEKEKERIIKLTEKKKADTSKTSSASIMEISETLSDEVVSKSDLKQYKSVESKKTEREEEMEVSCSNQVTGEQVDAFTEKRDTITDMETELPPTQNSIPSVVQHSDNSDRGTESDRREIIIAGQVITSQAQLEEVMADMLRTQAAEMAREVARPVLNPIAEQAESAEKKKIAHKSPEPCLRETVLYNHDEITSEAKTDVELDDNFFEVTETDVKRMMRDLQRTCENLSDKPMLTKAMKERMMEERASKYSRAFIRVQFSDRSVLQGAFTPQETVGALYRFVTDHLKDKTISFYLYTTPPRHVLKDKSITLTQAELVPLTVVYFGTESASSPEDGYLSSAVLAEKSNPEVADEIVYKHMPVQNTSKGRPIAESSNPSSSKRQKSKPAESKDGKNLPKWFQIGKK